MKYYIGFDIGSVSVNCAVLDEQGKVVEEFPYSRHFGNPIDSLKLVLNKLAGKYGAGLASVSFTGNHGERIAKDSDSHFEFETICQVYALEKFFPNVRTLITIGGQDYSFLSLKSSEKKLSIDDFGFNASCAAGTGSFIDKQAERLFKDDVKGRKFNSEQERMDYILKRFIETGSKSKNPAKVASRCTVFAKSDLIHLQNIGVKLADAIYGLHIGSASNFKSNIESNRDLQEPIALAGGLSFNPLAIKALQKVIGKNILIPTYSANLGAIGAALSALQNHDSRVISLKTLDKLGKEQISSIKTTKPLSIKKTRIDEHNDVDFKFKAGKTEVYMGIDVGSTSTNFVLLTKKGEVVYKIYTATKGRPITAVKDCLKEIRENVGNKIKIIGVGTTGSGRNAAGLFVGADLIGNEITAHATGTLALDPKVDTIFELGGQDAKFMTLDKNGVIDFKMNKVCAAGTGSFFEEIADMLNIKVKGEFEKIALSAKRPLQLSDRCTVYMESDIVAYQQMGFPINDILAGTALAITHNYKNRVVQDGKIGKYVSIQGGTALNKSFLAGAERVISETDPDTEFVALKHREVMGALGIAIQVKMQIGEKEGYKTRFRDFKIINEEVTWDEENCNEVKSCHNNCKIHIYTFGDKRIKYGGTCGRFEATDLSRKRTPNYFALRKTLFYKQIKDRFITPSKITKTDKLTVGISRALSFHQLGIFWVTLFDELGFMVVLSDDTSDSIVSDGVGLSNAENCFPVKVAHGHAKNLADKVDYLLLPTMINMETPHKDEKGYYCPHVESTYYVLKAALGLDEQKVIHPNVFMRSGNESIISSIKKELERLRLNTSKVENAFWTAMEAQEKFEKDELETGKKIIDNMDKDDKATVILGRPYNLYDERICLQLGENLSNMGVHAIPMTLFDFDGIDINNYHPNMYWGFGSKLIRAAFKLLNDKRLFPIYVTNFGCGPDSFMLHYFKDLCAKAKRPYLELEFDEHTSKAGILTRLEAYSDVINNHDCEDILDYYSLSSVKIPGSLKDRTLFIPQMNRSASHLLAGSFRHFGIKAEVLPTYDGKDMAYGMRYSSGKECFPFMITTQDMISHMETLIKEGKKPSDIVFFMPDAQGPCRFGQYNIIQRMLFDSVERYKGAVVISPTSDENYSLGRIIEGQDAIRLKVFAWKSFIVGDILLKALHRTRPYEKNKGETEKVFNICLDDAACSIEKKGSRGLTQAMKRSADRFINIEKVDDLKKPKVLVNGEIFLRSHEAGNQNVIKELEDLGVECSLSSLGEWMSYVTYMRIRESKKFSKDWQKQIAQKLFQDFEMNKIFNTFRKYLEGRKDHNTENIISHTNGIFHADIGGEAVLTIGSSLIEDFDGVVDVGPLNCMPDTVSASILSIKMHEDGKPYIHETHDGTKQSSRRLALATFTYQVRQKFLDKGSDGIK